VLPGAELRNVRSVTRSVAEYTERRRVYYMGGAECHRVYYMGEGGGFPRVRAVVCLVVRSARGLSQHQRVSWNVN